MKITYIKLVNFAGIYAGTGKKEIEIDFTKNKNKMIMLLGGNGSGKSTLMSLLTPFRTTEDGRKELIIEDEKGYKEIHYKDGKNVYIIKHHYLKNKNKSFIEKNGKELNENGSIRNFDSILENELNVTTDYLKIGRLSSNLNSFINLSSTARKSYINQFIPNIDDYLEAFQTAKDKLNYLNKRLKTLNTSIEKYSSFDKLKNEYNVIKKEKDLLVDDLNNIKSNILNINNTIDYIEAEKNIEIKKLDKPIEYIDELETEINKLESNYNSLKTRISIDDDNYKDELIRLKSKLNFYSNDKLINIIENKKNLKLELNDLNDKLTINKDKLDSLNTNLGEKKYDLENLELCKKLIEDLELAVNFNNEDINNDVKEISEYLKGYQLSDIYKIINTIEIFSDSIDSIITSYDNHLIENIDINFTKDKLFNLKNKLEGINNNYNKISNMLDDTTNLINEINNKKFLLNALEKRPINCSIDECNFISESLNYKNNEFDKLDNLYQNLSKLEDTKTKLEKDKSNIENEFNLYNDILNLFNCKSYNELDKFILTSRIKYKYNKEDINDKDIKEFVFSIIKRHDYLKDELNIKQELDYVINLNNLEKCRMEYDSIKNYLDLVEKNKEINLYLEKEINDYKIKILNTNENLKKLDSEENNIMENIESLNSRIIVYEKVIKMIEDLHNKKELYKSISESYNYIKELSNKIYNYDKEKNTLCDKQEKLEKIINDKDNNIEEISKNINVLESLLNEMKDIETSYDYYKLVKDSLDIKNGIPIIFIGNFIKDIANKTNKLLNIAYNGSFQIKFDMNNTDFFINVFKSNGTMLNDIQNASQGETSLTTVSLSLAMIEKMIEKYNIVYLDEIDATLSVENRRKFISLINKQIEDLDIDQIFIISHNNEFSSYPVDLILMDDTYINDNEFMDDKVILYS